MEYWNIGILEKSDVIFKICVICGRNSCRSFLNPGSVEPIRVLHQRWVLSRLIQEGQLIAFPVGDGHAGGYQVLLFISNLDVIGGNLSGAVNFH